MKRTKIIKNIFLIFILILLIIKLIFFLTPYFKAWNAGVNVKYFHDERYCEKDSDCIYMTDCRSVNIYNPAYCPGKLDPYRVICIDNSCTKLVEEIEE